MGAAGHRCGRRGDAVTADEWVAVSAAAVPSPVVLDSPHSGRSYPAQFAFLPPLAQMRRAEDALVDELFAAGPALGAPLVAARFPRTFIDCNRALADLDPELLAEPWPEPLRPGPKTRLGRGLVWRTLGWGEPIYAEPLTVADVNWRIERCYRPYHAALADLLDRAHAAFGAVWHVNCHSMASVGGRLAPDGHGTRRPDMVLGDRDGASTDPDFTRLVAGTLEAMGYRVAVNDPYRGAELVRRHGRPREARHSLQIELNRGLYLDEKRQEPHAGFDRLRCDLETLVGRIVAYARSRCG